MPKGKISQIEKGRQKLFELCNGKCLPFLLKRKQAMPEMRWIKRYECPKSRMDVRGLA